MDHFGEAVRHNPEIQDLMKKVESCADPEIFASSSTETHALVEIILKDGKTFSHRVTKRKGSPTNPLTDQELEAKFRSCTVLPWGILQYG